MSEKVIKDSKIKKFYQKLITLKELLFLTPQEKKFINFKCKKCICKTLKKKICKINTNHIYCHVHRDFDFFHKLSFSQSCKQYKCRMCEKNCMNDLFYIFNLAYFCSAVESSSNRSARVLDSSFKAFIASVAPNILGNKAIDNAAPTANTAPIIAPPGPNNDAICEPC